MGTQGDDRRLYPNLTHDLVVVVPGIMGSELYDTVRRRTLWGASVPLLLRSWLDGAPLRDLALDERETAGEYGRVRPTRLLRLPEWLPFLRGAEPYTRLVDAARGCVVDPRALLEFPYDWRLPVGHNSGLLGTSVLAALERWRATPEHEGARRRHPTGRPAMVVMVAHSMGGLLARQAAAIPGMRELIRAVVTLGTPFHGSLKAAALLNTGVGLPVPLPSHRPLASLGRPDADDGVRALAATLPGLYDLLPRFRCVDDGGDGRHLTCADVRALGGDPDHTEAWASRQTATVGTLDDHRLVLGGAQPTPQSLRLSDGVVTLLHTELGTSRSNRYGDGTVPTGSAELPGLRPVRFAQQHQDLARADAVLREVTRTLRERDLDQLGPPLGDDEGVGVEVPDTPVAAGLEWTATVRGVSRPSEVEAAVVALSNGHRRVPWPVEIRDGSVQVPVTLPAPGLYRLELTSRAGIISQVVLAGPSSGAHG
ncbi:hypothetical protein [Micromonospora sp. NPDC047527]|uniref:PGAP1-like alpha/beta domain-containing protein n=1 Tax=unclassified Micromonospora TaxID=2617518 RepID=UPI0033E0FF0B